MNHCVPNWDLENETVSSSNLVTMTKGYWDSMQPKRSISLDHEIEELLWEKGPVVNKMIKRPAKVTDNDDAVLPGKPSLTVKDSLMDSVATEITGSSMQEDELAQFLYYPLDDAFDREYCSEFFEGMPSSNMYMHKDSLANPSTTVSSIDRVSTISTHKEFSLPCEGSSTQWTPIFANMMGSSGNGTAAVKASKEPMNSKPAAVDKAMASGTGRISGLPPPPSSDTLPRLWTSQSPLSKCQTNVQNSTPRDTQTDSKKAALQVAGSRAAMPPPKMQAADGPAAKAERTKLVNFSHFSRPAAAIKANLQSIGSVSGLSSTGIMSRLDKLRSDGNSAAEPSIIESNTVEWTAAGSSNGANSKKAQGCYQANRNPSPKKGSEVATTSSEDLADSSAKVSEPVARQNSDAGRSLASATTEKVGEGGDGPEPTITSSSGGSGNSGVRLRKEMNHSGKRKARDVEDSECQSEDVEFESVDRKKQAPSRTTSKRSRAAEVHNLSERRRRDRINEKMRALQELIPHCNKSDKASMLDEAIEYLKTLQLQVQLMSMGGGMGMTPMVLPGGMQHFQVPQMAHLPHLGMGIGMGMGYSMGMLEISASSARPVMPLSSMHVPALPASAIHCPASITMPGMPGPSIPIQRCAGSGLQLSGLPVSNLPLAGLSGPPQPGLVPVSASIPTDLQDQMQSANIMHYQSQQQMQVGPQVMNGNLYNPSMAQQPVQTSAQASGRETEQGNTGNTG